MIEKSNVLLTGATGFVGNAVLMSLLGCKRGTLSVRAAVRVSSTKISCTSYVIGDMAAATDWSDALFNQSVVIHCAARAHIMKDEVADPLTEYRKVNVDGTLNLARQAAEAGVRRFIFLSSIKVNGESTNIDQLFTPADKPAPEDPYGQSKLEAEQGLLALAEETGMEVVIIRPPLVYGPGVKGNFASLIKLAQKNLPLPLGAVDNRRSLVALDNLVDLIITCIDHPAAANQTFLVSDDHDLSTAQLLRELTLAAGKSPRLLPFPPVLLKTAATLLGKRAVADRLLGSLQVDITHTRETLNWTPPVKVQDGLKRCFECFECSIFSLLC